MSFFLFFYSICLIIFAYDSLCVLVVSGLFVCCKVGIVLHTNDFYRKQTLKRAKGHMFLSFCVCKMSTLPLGCSMLRNVGGEELLE